MQSQLRRLDRGLYLSNVLSSASQKENNLQRKSPRAFNLLTLY